MDLPREAVATLTSTVMKASSGGLYFWCRFQFEKTIKGSVWMPDEETHWAEHLRPGVQILVERLRPNSEFPSRIAGTAKLLCDQTTSVLSVVKQSRSDEHSNRQSYSMPKASKDPALRDAINNIAANSNQKPSQVVRQLCWEAIYHRSAILHASELINDTIS